MTVREAFDFFKKLKLTPFHKQVAEKLIDEIQDRLKFLLEVGLDYITLDNDGGSMAAALQSRFNVLW